MKYKDYYEILGVDRKAGTAEIKKAYRHLAKKYHPDRNPGDKKSEEKFKEINEAFEVLGNEDKRKKYDAMGSTGYFYNGMDFDPSQFGGFSGGRTYTYSTGNTDFSDFFNMFFGGNGSFGFEDLFNHSRRDSMQDGFSSRDLKGQNIESEITVDIEEAYSGAKKQFSFDAGMGVQTISVTIPAGIMPGKKIKIKEQGLPGPTGKKGDLLLKVNFRKHGKYRLDGLDIHSFVEVFPWEAYFGAEKVIETLDGKIKIKIPERINSGKKIKIQGKGYKNMEGHTGNLYAEIRIVNPEHLPPEIEKAYKSMK